MHSKLDRASDVLEPCWALRIGAILFSVLSWCACKNGAALDLPLTADEVTLLPAEHIAAPTGISSTPLFACVNASFAWGPVVRGFVIDDAGRVWSFDWSFPRKPSDSKLARAAGPFTVGGNWFERAPLVSEFSPADSSARLPASVVAKYKALIEPARLGKITSTFTAVDAGGDNCEAYFWNAAHDAYQAVELGSFGDVTVVNGASAARALHLWLRAVERAVQHPSKAP